MTNAVRSEWTKLRSVPSTPWLLLGTVLATIAVGALATATVHTSHCPTPTTCFEDTTKLSLTGVWLGQVVVVVLATLAFGHEYGTRMIQTTLTATPRRRYVVAGKVVVVTATALLAGALGVLGSLAVARLILPANGFAAPSLADAVTLRAAGGTTLYFGLIALLSLGLAAVVRDTAGTVTVALALLFGAPIVAAFVSDPVWQHRLDRWSPTSVGLAIQTTLDVGRLPIGPWAGLGLLAAYAFVALAAGALTLAARDA